MNLNDAGRIIEIIDRRVRELTRSMSRVETTWGDIYSVANDGRTVNVFLYGESDSSYVSEDFRTINGIIPQVGDSIKVAMDKSRGDRWVEEVQASSAYYKLGFDLSSGYVLVGGGTTMPTFGTPGQALKVNAGGTGLEYGEPSFTLPASASFTTLTADDLNVNTSIDLADTVTIDWSDVSLSRESADLLKTDGRFHATGGLFIDAPNSSYGFNAIRVSVPNNGYVAYAQHIAAEAQPTFKFAGYGSLEWGPGGSSPVDVSLGRASAGVLQMGADNVIESSGEAWIAPTFTNSWVDYNTGFANAAYRKDAQGYVHLRGLIKSGTIGTAAFNLPAGYRPAAGTNSTLVFGTLSSSGAGRVDVTSAGDVNVLAPSANAWTSLEGITFKAEG